MATKRGRGETRDPSPRLRGKIAGRSAQSRPGKEQHGAKETKRARGSSNNSKQLLLDQLMAHLVPSFKGNCFLRRELSGGSTCGHVDPTNHPGPSLLSGERLIPCLANCDVQTHSTVDKSGQQACVCCIHFHVMVNLHHFPLLVSVLNEIDGFCAVDCAHTDR